MKPYKNLFVELVEKRDNVSFTFAHLIRLIKEKNNNLNKEKGSSFIILLELVSRFLSP